MKPILILCLVFFGWAMAQPDSANADREPQADHAVLLDVGLGVGWPGYQLYHAHFGLQRDAFGVVFRGSWTEVGPYLSLAGRYYTPLPLPLPTFVSAGAGVFGGAAVPFATLGAHVPFFEDNARLTLELGASYQTVLGRGQVLPFVTLGLGYVFVVDAAPISARERAERERERLQPASCTPRGPDASALRRTFREVVRREVAEAKVTYAGVYRDPHYSYEITGVTVEGNEGAVTADWRAEATQIAGGERISGSGSLDAEFVWNGCAWALRAYRFS